MVVLGKGQAPTFTVPDQDGNKVSLQDYAGKWVVLYFYPKDNTPGCTIEAIDFTRLKQEFADNNTVILGVSADSEREHCKFIEKKNLSITLLSDRDKLVMNKYRVWGKKKFMGREFMGIISSTFLIDPQGKIAHVWSPVRVKGHADEVLAKLKELN